MATRVDEDPISCTYSFIKSVKRIKLIAQRFKNLIFVHSNLRLLSRKEDDYTKGALKYWDIGGDHFAVEEDDLLDVAYLSIDDPALETIIFDEEENLQME
ncbi:hypothetical protein P3X46_012227 [Hevea brasiliensis]|uniref:Uncharacterized protein n=1 Tax=Hevea brasiliensis TaxID=3981 RepID=A0ABQ9M9N1_HEVBR|nr:hypothetical protein P3X46_012227 [Hevea brasiliensis]